MTKPRALDETAPQRDRPPRSAAPDGAARGSRIALVEDDCGRAGHAAAADLEVLRGRSLLVTGGTGFFGTWLLECLAWANRNLDLRCDAWVLTRDAGRFARKAPHLAAHDRFHLFEGDVRDFGPPRADFAAVIHAAAEASAKLNAEAPLEMIDTIVTGTRRVLEVAAGARAERFLFVSSGGVYGRQPPELSHVPEGFTGGPDPVQPGNAYHEAKRLAELLCATYAAGGRVPVTIARCFAFVGPHLPLDAHFAIGNFIRDGLAGGPLVVKGDGTPHRSYQYASDLVVWLLAILARGRAGRPYNVGSDAAVSIAELAHAVAAEIAPRPPVEVLGTPQAGVPAERYVPSVERARQELGLECSVGLGEAIRKTIAWHRAA